MRSIVAASIFLLTALAAVPAFACRTSRAHIYSLFEDMPSAPAGTFAARVEIVEGRGFRVKARVVEMLTKDKAPKTLVFDYSAISSCDQSPQTGEVGIVVGKILYRMGDEAVIRPMRVPSEYQRSIISDVSPISIP
jgi:hypothetical protein